MGLNESADSIIDSFYEMGESAKAATEQVISLAEEILGDLYSFSYSGESWSPHESDIYNMLKASFRPIKAQFKKYNVPIGEDDDRLDKTFSMIARQVASSIKIGGIWTFGESRLGSDLDRMYLYIANRLNFYRHSNIDLPPEIRETAGDIAKATNGAADMLGRLSSTGVSFATKTEESVRWAQEIIKQRNELIPKVLRQYVESKKLYDILKSMESGDYEKKKEAIEIAQAGIELHKIILLSNLSEKRKSEIKANIRKLESILDKLING